MRVEENTEAYMDTVPSARRVISHLVVFRVFPCRQYAQRARVCLAGGQNKNRVKPFKYCAKWIFMGLYAIDVVIVFGLREGSRLSEVRYSPWLGADRTFMFYIVSDSERTIKSIKKKCAIYIGP